MICVLKVAILQFANCQIILYNLLHTLLPVLRPLISGWVWSSKCSSHNWTHGSHIFAHPRLVWAVPHGVVILGEAASAQKPSEICGCQRHPESDRRPKVVQIQKIMVFAKDKVTLLYIYIYILYIYVCIYQVPPKRFPPCRCLNPFGSMALMALCSEVQPLSFSMVMALSSRRRWFGVTYSATVGRCCSCH